MTNPTRGACRRTFTCCKGALLGLTLCLLGFGAPARSTPLGGRAPQALVLLAQRQDAIGPDQAAAVARKVTGGRVLAVTPAKRHGAVVYKVRVLLPDGRVRVVIIDAKSGRVVG